MVKNSRLGHWNLSLSSQNNILGGLRDPGKDLIPRKMVIPQENG